MKSTLKRVLLCTAAVALTFAASQAYAASTTFDANATVVTPIAITSSADLNFGNFAPTASPGTVHINNAGARSQTNVTPITGGTIGAAAFTVTGTASMPYTVTLPATANITSGSDTMSVSFATADVTGGTLSQTLDGSGNGTLALGGTVTVAANQPAGSYTGTYTMTVDY